MKNTLMVTFGSLVLASTLTVLAVAQGGLQAKPAKPMTVARMTVSLKCTPVFANSDVDTKVTIENNTGATIAKSTLVSWKTNGGLSGAISLPNALQPGQTVVGIKNVPSNATSCTASFVK